MSCIRRTLCPSSSSAAVMPRSSTASCHSSGPSLPSPSVSSHLMISVVEFPAAGGRGVRMKSLTRHPPHELLSVANPSGLEACSISARNASGPARLIPAEYDLKMASALLPVAPRPEWRRVSAWGFFRSGVCCMCEEGGSACASAVSTDAAGSEVVRVSLPQSLLKAGRCPGRPRPETCQERQLEKHRPRVGRSQTPTTIHT